MALQEIDDSIIKNKGDDRFTSQKSSSEPDLATAERRSFRTGFPPGITVDELWLYRRKRPSENLWPQDNLTLSEGSFKSLKTEYRRRFKNFYDFGSCGKLSIKREDLSPVRSTKPEDSLKLEGSLELLPEYNEFFIEYPVERPVRFKPITEAVQVIDSPGQEMTEISSDRKSEIKSQFIKYPTLERSQLIKRPSNLKLEGDLYTTTESAEKFIQYLLTKRPDLARKATTLKLEGEMDIKTEMRDKYAPPDYQSRPPLCKKFTNLHLEGELDIVSEKQDKFRSYQLQKRPPLVKKMTNLQIEGDLDFMPEYRREFIEYKTERPKPALPINNLKTDGFSNSVPTVSKPFEQQMHPQIPFLRGPDIMMDDTACRSRIASRRGSHLRLEGPVESLSESRRQFVEKPICRVERSSVPNNLHLEGRIDMYPEYRNAYVDFSKDRCVSPGRVRGRRISQQQGNLRSEGKMEISPEYSHSYVDFPRERPRLRRPECSLSSEGDLDHMTEQNEKYVPFSNVPKTELIRRESELKLEGNIECQPEYRKAYIDYLIRERAERKSRPLDNLGTQRRVVDAEPSLKTSIVADVHSASSNRSTIQENMEHIRTESASRQMKPPSSGVLSVPSSPKAMNKGQGSRSPRNRSLSQIEASIFGPKLTVPVPGRRLSGSRSPTVASSGRKSRTLPRSKTISPAADGRSSRNEDHKFRKFGSPVRVENMANRTSAPLPPIRNFSARNKWMRDSSVESSSAFVVLDKEINNNYDRDYVTSRGSTKRLSGWYNPTTF